MAKKKEKGDAALVKLEPDEGLQYENLNLAVEREEIFTRMELLNKEAIKFKNMYLKLEAKNQDLAAELQIECARGLRDRTDADRDRLALEFQVKQLKETIIREHEASESTQAALIKDYEERLNKKQTEIEFLQQSEAASNEFRDQKEKMDQLIAQLRQDVENERKARLISDTEKDRDKLQATEKLNREMLRQIKMTKASLLALNDDQLQTTTRLTILQNTQLTIELEYQSKQTEQLLKENNQMQEQIETLNRDIAIHKEVEKELAKRSHFCQKVIKQLKAEIKELQDKQQDGVTPQQRRNFGYQGSKTVRHEAPKKLSLENELKSSEQLVNYLETKLEQHEKNLG